MLADYRREGDTGNGIMATPYVVSKIPLTKASNEFDRCNGETGSISGCTADVPSIGNSSCRFTCSSWCPMCERKPAPSQHDSLTKSFVDGLRKVDNGIHDGLKTLQPVMNKLNTQVISDNFSQKLTNLSQKAGLFVSPSKDVKGESGLSATNENGVHEKYVREVEALKGKIQELRENLNRQFSESESIITSIPKLLWNKDGCADNKSAVKTFNENENCVPAHGTECKRTKRLSESESCASPGIIVGQKRPRDFSPDPGVSLRALFLLTLKLASMSM